MLYINLNYTNLGYKIYITIFINHMQKNLRCNYWSNTNQLLPKQNNIAHIFHNLRWLGFISFVNLLCHKCVLRRFILPFLSLVIETNLSTWLKLRTPISNIKLKQMVYYLILLPLYKKFARGVHSHTVIYCCGWGTYHFH